MRTTKAKTTRAGRDTANLLRAAILGLTLTLGLTGANPEASAAPEKNTPSAKRADSPQAGQDRDNKQTGGKEAERADELPALTLTAPANNSANLYPAAFNLEAAVSFPGHAEDRNDKREGTDIEFLANGVKFAEAERAPYRASYTPPRAGRYTFTARIRYGEGKRTILSNAVDTVSDLPPTVTLTAPANNTVRTAPANFTLTANAAAPVGSIAKVEFYNGATLIGTAASAPYSASWAGVPAGTYTLTAKATDSYGFSTTSAPIAVIANAPPAVSLTGPANNTVQTAPANFTLTANASDPDGTIAKVEFYNGTTLLGTATAAPYSFIWANVPAGSYTITAIATDNYGAQTTSAAVAVTSNQAPTVSLTGPAANAVSVAPGSFTLTANAADADGTIAKVEFYNGTTLLGTATAAPYGYTWANVPAGTYSLTAIATDNLGASTTSAAVGVISDAPPTINLTSPAANAVSVAPGSFTLTASASSAISTIAKVEFYASSTSATGTTSTTLIGTATAAPYSYTWSNVPAGTYSLTAKATDALGTTATSATITVTSDAPPTITLTSPAAGAQITSPNSFSLTATAASITSTIAKVEFFNGTTLLGTATAAPYSFTWTKVPVGSYSITAKATDALGTATTSSAISVTAIANVPPTVSLTGPANGATVKVPGSFTLTANATSITSAIARVEFYNGTTLLGSSSAAPYSYTWSNVPLGTYSLTAKATDTLNATTISAPVSVTVNTGIAQAYYIHTDHLDTPRQITDTAGNIVWQWDNADPFGNNLPNENPNGQGRFENPLRFPGQYFDRETNTHYNVHRDYDPAIGRYVQSDPIGLAGGSFSTYTYVNSNPLSFVDPFGLYDLSFSTGFHVPVSSGVAVGPVFSSAIKNYSGNSNNPLVANPIGTDVAVGVIADVGVSAGVSDLSGTGGACAGNTINLGAGRYAGAQITFRQSQDQTKSIFNPLRYIDGASIGLGVGIATPVSFSRGF